MSLPLSHKLVQHSRLDICQFGMLDHCPTIEDDMAMGPILRKAKPLSLFPNLSAKARDQYEQTQYPRHIHQSVRATT